MTITELRKLRIKLKIDLLELSAYTGLPDSYLSKIEEGQITPLPTDLSRIEKAIYYIEGERRRDDPDDSMA